MKKLLFDAVERAQEEAQGIDALLKAAGIAPPPSLPDRPKADWSEIPEGARFTDAEISASLARDIAVGITALAQAMSQCIREDAAALFAQLQAAKLKLAHSSLQLAKEKAWLVPPPLHKEPVPS